MKELTAVWRQLATVIAVLAVLGISSQAAMAQSPVRLKGEGAIDLSTGDVSVFAFHGTASHLGQYQCHGEVTLSTGREPGSQDGVGVAVFVASNGDKLVGIVTMHAGIDGTGKVHFAWQDSVKFSDGTIVRNTGRFIDSRPPGATEEINLRRVFINIIAILIGL